MANFPALTLTDNGISIQTKAQTGQPLAFTRIAVGDGEFSGDISELTALLNEKQTLDITSIAIPSAGAARLRTTLSNAGLGNGYYVREIGLFANDPDDENEYLYAYSNAGNQSDYLPAEGGTTVVEQLIDVITLVGNASNISAVIDDSLIYATMQDIYDNLPSIVRRPLNITPAADAVTTRYPALAGGPYYPLHTIPQTARHFEIFDNAAGTGEPLYSATENAASESAPALTHTPDDPLTESTDYWWRYRDETALGEYSAYSEITRFETAAVYVETPSVTAPADSATDIGETPTVTISAFSVFGGADTHTATQVQILLASDDSVIYDSGTLGPVTSHEIPGGNLEEGETSYKVQARYQGDEQGWSEWSTTNTFTTADEFVVLSPAGSAGFGVGVYPYSLPAGFAALSGYDDPVHANYGNYQYSDGSVMCFIPAFYYRIGHASSPNYADYGANAIDILLVANSEFADTTAANAAGYALHRAFIDGGDEKSGFFVDKYICSKNITDDAGRSAKNEAPISLSSASNVTQSAGMPGCSGFAADAIVLSRARGSGFNCASIFQLSALSMMSLAHAQASDSTTYCAWYDAAGTTNFPKGCNNSLADYNDPSVTFTWSGDTVTSGKPLAGSASNLAKTTHNGQLSGVTDVNGSLANVAIGITQPGADANATGAYGSADCFVLKESVALSTLTAGFGGSTDAWGTDVDLETNYTEMADFLPWGTSSGATDLGNGAEQVLAADLSGINWLRTSCGMPSDMSAFSESGTNLFGNDSFQKFNPNNLVILCFGHYSETAAAGIFRKQFNNNRIFTSIYPGFRAAYYAN